MVDLEPRTRPPRVIPISAEAEELLLQAARLLTDPSAFWHGGEDVAISAQHELFVIAARLYNELYLVLPAPPLAPPQGQEDLPAGSDPALAWAAPIPFCTEAVAPPVGELLRDLAVQHTARVLTALHSHLIPAEMDRLAQHRGDDAQLLPARFSGAARWLRAQLDWLTDYLTPGELEFQADAKAAAEARAEVTALCDKARCAEGPGGLPATSLSSLCAALLLDPLEQRWPVVFAVFTDDALAQTRPALDLIDPDRAPPGYQESLRAAQVRHRPPPQHRSDAERDAELARLGGLIADKRAQILLERKQRRPY